MGFKLGLKVIPNSSICKLIKEETGIKLKITTPAIEGKANKHVIEFLAKAFSQPKKSIAIILGDKNKQKIIHFTELNQENGQKRLKELLGE